MISIILGSHVHFGQVGNRLESPVVALLGSGAESWLYPLGDPNRTSSIARLNRRYHPIPSESLIRDSARRSFKRPSVNLLGYHWPKILHWAEYASEPEVVLVARCSSAQKAMKSAIGTF